MEESERRIQQIDAELIELQNQITTKESQLEQLNAGRELNRLQESIDQNEREMNELRMLCRASQAGGAMNGSFVMDEILSRTQREMKKCLADANLDSGLSAESLNESIDGLENDVVRLKNDRMDVFGKLKVEEGRLKEVERQLNELEQMLDEGMKEIRQEYAEYHFQSEDYYDILSEFQDRKQIVEHVSNSIECSGR